MIASFGLRIARPLPPMIRKRLGKTDLEVSPLALGCWAFAGDANWGPQDDEASIRTIHAALDAGINLLDTAPAYGDGKSESVVGQALQGRRDRAVLATKVSPADLAPDRLKASCERSLERLGAEAVDLLQIHWPSREVPFEDTIAGLETLRQEGKIRHAAVCNFGKGDLAEYLEKGGFAASNQLPYSLLSRAIEDEIVPLCQANGIAILPYSPLMQGLLAGKWRRADDVPEGRARTRHFSGDRPQARHKGPGCEAATFEAIERIRSFAERRNAGMAAIALAWLMSKPAVASVIVGARSPEQVAANLASLEVSLQGDETAELERLTEPVKQALGNDPDLWAAENRFR